MNLFLGCEVVTCIEVAQRNVMWWCFVKTAMNCKVSWLGFSLSVYRLSTIHERNTAGLAA
jgi:hypothetical protein